MKRDAHTLIVVDMQPSWFTAAGEEEVLAGCKRAIKKAMRNKNPVIFVEWDGTTHPTASELTNLTDGYERTYFLSKRQQDGSPQVTELMKKKRLPKKIVRVCGVNTDACVLSTVKGLRSKLDSTLHLLEDAVGGAWSDTWRSQYNSINNLITTKA